MKLKVKTNPHIELKATAKPYHGRRIELILDEACRMEAQQDGWAWRYRKVGDEKYGSWNMVESNSPSYDFVGPLEPDTEYEFELAYGYEIRWGSRYAELGDPNADQPRKRQ